MILDPRCSAGIKIEVDGSVGFAGEKDWILNESIRFNITLCNDKKQIDFSRYKRVIDLV